MFINGGGGLPEEMGAENQQYCLRWNNHSSNLIVSFEVLYEKGDFTDVEINCQGHTIRCHRVVLAACSSYFEDVLRRYDRYPNQIPIIILGDVKYSEMKAILEYMYKGSVNVAQCELSGLLRASQVLKVRGLVQDLRVPSTRSPSPPNRSPYNNPPAAPSVSSSNELHSASSTPTPTPNYSKSNNSTPVPKFNANDSSIYETLCNASNAMQTPLPYNNLWSGSTTGSTGSTRKRKTPSPKNHVIGTQNNSMNYENSQNEPISMKKKKFMGQSKDTPILRNVLGHHSHQQHNSISIDAQTHNYHHHGLQNQHPQSIPYHMPIATNGPIEHNDKVGTESPNHIIDGSARSVDGDKVHEDKQILFTIGTNDKPASNQKPEWKRYKQYTREHINAAINAVRNGMSALQAARKYSVPSRTLYDKVKKLGIVTQRPYKSTKNNCPNSPYAMTLKSEDTSSYSPEDNHLQDNMPITGNGGHSPGGNGIENDSDQLSQDRLDSEAGCSVKQELSPPLDDDKEDSNDDIRHRNHILHRHEHVENGSEVFINSSPRDREPSEPEDMRSASE